MALLKTSKTAKESPITRRLTVRLGIDLVKFIEDEAHWRFGGNVSRAVGEMIRKVKCGGEDGPVKVEAA